MQRYVFCHRTGSRDLNHVHTVAEGRRGTPTRNRDVAGAAAGEDEAACSEPPGGPGLHAGETGGGGRSDRRAGKTARRRGRARGGTAEGEGGCRGQAGGARGCPRERAAAGTGQGAAATAGT